MKEILLTQNQVALVDDEDYHWLNQYNWYAISNSNTNGHYAARKVRGSDGKQKTLLMARAILGLSFGDRRQVDHINRNPLDNRRENLRIVSHRENLINRGVQKNNTSGAQGVSWHKGTEKWQVRIRVEGKLVHLGLFEHKADAIARYEETEAYYGYSKIRNFKTIGGKK